MSVINKVGQAGTLESSDVMVTVSPGEAGSGIHVELKSIVAAQYGKAIRTTLINVAEEQEISDIYINAVDRGALDCTIRARVLAALGRAGAVLTEEVR